MKNLVAQTSSFKMALKENMKYNKNMDHLVSSDCFSLTSEQLHFSQKWKSWHVHVWKCVCVFPGTGKTTFIRMLAGGLRPDGEGESLSLRWSRIKPDAPTDPELCLSGEVPILNVSYKPQTISPKFKVSSHFLTADPWQDHPSACFTAFSLLIDFSQQTEFTEIQGSESKKFK